MTTDTTATPYDTELGKITDQDREYAQELIDGYEQAISEAPGYALQEVAQWLRKVRYEAVIADRKSRQSGR